MSNDNIKSKLTNPERIARLISRMCSGGMQVVIRDETTSSVGIRGNFLEIRPAANTKVIYFNNVSVHGRAALNKGDIVKIEKFGKSFDQLTRETVKAFLVDSRKSKFKI